METDTYTITEFKDVTVELKLGTFTVDVETIPVLKDGETPTIYQFHSVLRSVHYDANGNCTSPDSKINFVVHRIKGSVTSTSSAEQHGCSVAVYIDGVKNTNSSLLQTISEGTSIDFSMFPGAG